MSAKKITMLPSKFKHNDIVYATVFDYFGKEYFIAAKNKRDLVRFGRMVFNGFVCSEIKRARLSKVKGVRR